MEPLLDCVKEKLKCTECLSLKAYSMCYLFCGVTYIDVTQLKLVPSTTC